MKCRVFMEKEYLFVAITGILSGLLVFGGRVFENHGLSLFEIAFFPQLLVVLMLLPFMVSKRYRVVRGTAWNWILYGCVMVVLVLSEYGGVILGVPVAIAVLLLYTQPLWTIMISRVFMGEDISGRKYLACAVVLAGLIILVNPFGTSMIGNPLGIVVSLVGGVSLSGWVILGSIISKKKSPPVMTKFISACLTVFLLLLSYPLLYALSRSQSIASFSFGLPIWIWIALVGFTFFAEVVSHIFYYKGVKKVPASDAGIILLLEPVTGALLATAFLNQALTANIILGGALILAANYLVVKAH